MLNAAARVVSGTQKFDRSLSQLLHSELHNVVSSINSESQFTGVCRTRLLSTWSTTARVHWTSQAATAFDRPTVTSWWFHDTVAAHLVVGLSPSRVRWNGTRFHTLRDPARSTNGYSRRWKLIFLWRKGTISALEALHDALYKSTTTSTTITTTTTTTMNQYDWYTGRRWVGCYI